MRLLHTSDWHLGRSFHREGMGPHQAAFIDHLVEVVVAEQVDVVLVAGDIYDRALPPVDAVKLADEAFARLAGAGARVVVTSGNHDSAIRLGAHSRLIDAAGVHLRTELDQVGTPVLVGDEHGEVAVHGLPYLDPTSAQAAWDLPTRSHEAALSEAMHRVRADLSTRPTARSVVLAHAFVAGAAPSDSERDITVGGVSRVPVQVFEGIDYVALGHLHGAHELTPHLRYSGSPLAYSFSEAAHTKGSWLVDLGPDGLAGARFVPAPVPRPLGVLRGRLEDLLTQAAHAVWEQAWLQVTLTDPVRPDRAMERLRVRFPHTLVLAFEPEGARPLGTPHAPAHLDSAHDVALEFVHEVRGAPATAAEEQLLREAVDACCADPDQDPRTGVVVAR